MTFYILFIKDSSRSCCLKVTSSNHQLDLYPLLLMTQQAYIYYTKVSSTLHVLVCRYPFLRPREAELCVSLVLVFSFGLGLIPDLFLGEVRVGGGTRLACCATTQYLNR